MTSYDQNLFALSFVTVSPVALQSLQLGLGAVLGLWTLLFLFRIVLTWYPQLDLERGVLRWIQVPTEPLLAPTRRWIQPIGGVDVAPVIWVGLTSLLRELLVGQQGLVTQFVRQVSANLA